MRTTLSPTPRTRPRLQASLRLVPIGCDHWRVLDAAGLIVGHVDARADPHGTRYRARRYQPAARRFLELGEFWSIDDAVDCLRLSR
ncbi:hypothetical protein [Microbacterium luticocti]|uniref:hypothetical protein n=1 Tax=Microbacterium luticocti TaxID=451764 RepID=UPI0004156A66|nr:hypothetical protein [Microbacterium luticocti]